MGEKVDMPIVMDLVDVSQRFAGLEFHVIDLKHAIERVLQCLCSGFLQKDCHATLRVSTADRRTRFRP